jgi:DNA helicase IV
MAGVLSRAVVGLRQVPATDIEVKVGGTAYRLTPRLLSQARDEAERRRDPGTGAPLPHNTARRAFVNAAVRKLARQRGSDLGGQRSSRPADAEDLRELAAAPAVRSALDSLWPELEPQHLLTQLYQQPDRLDLTGDERAAIARDRPGPWTLADVPLLDELAELLGPVAAVERAARRRRADAEAERAETIEYAAQLVAQLAADDAIVLPALEVDAFTTWIADRNTGAGAGGMLAERALQDRTWAYGHVIVDEAQELSAMAWRMVLRRCPARSMTVVGDLAQTSTPAGADSWAQVLDPVAAGRWRTARLTVNYRTPAPVMALAAALLPPGADPPLSVRDSDEEPWYADAEDLAELVRRETELIGAGRVAVIAPPARVAETAATLNLSPGPDLDADVAVLTPEQAKGLEFDSVIIVDPAGIERAAPRGRADLYVALTRTTRRLGLISPGEMPRDLRAMLGQS